MKRRRILGYAAGAAGAGVVAACSPQQGGGAVSGDLPTVRWRMATSWPQSLNTIYGGATTVCDRISALTDGRFTIDPYAAGEIVPRPPSPRCRPRRHRRMWSQRRLLLRGQKSGTRFWHHRSLWPQRATAKRLVLPRWWLRNDAQALC